MKNIDKEMLEIDERFEIERHPCEDFIHLGRVYEHYTWEVWWMGYGNSSEVYCEKDCVFCKQEDCRYIFYFKKNTFSTTKCNKYGGPISFIMAYNKIDANEALDRIKKMLNGDLNW